jgi:hypothetical protein
MGAVTATPSVMAVALLALPTAVKCKKTSA